MEQALQSLPRKEDLHSLALAMSDMRGEMREVRASVQEPESEIMSPRRGRGQPPGRPSDETKS